MIKRSIQILIEKKLGDTKALIVLGARQTGKTTLLKALFKNLDKAL
jgi:predicted AAA+ superfamily ATPase